MIKLCCGCGLVGAGKIHALRSLVIYSVNRYIIYLPIILSGSLSEIDKLVKSLASEARICGFEAYSRSYENSRDRSRPRRRVGLRQL